MNEIVTIIFILSLCGLSLLIYVFIRFCMGLLNFAEKNKSFFGLFNTELLKYIYSEKALHKRIGLGIASENKNPKDMYDFHVVIQLKSFTIVFCHQIRGDLIYVFDKINIESHKAIIEYSYNNKDKAKLSYVDQSNSYSFLGTNNIINKYSDDKIIDLYHEFNLYTKGEL